MMQEIRFSCFQVVGNAGHTIYGLDLTGRLWVRHVGSERWQPVTMPLVKEAENAA